MLLCIGHQHTQYIFIINVHTVFWCVFTQSKLHITLHEYIKFTNKNLYSNLCMISDKLLQQLYTLL